MKTKRADFAAASLRGRMIVAGGLGESVTLWPGLSASTLQFALILHRCMSGHTDKTYGDYLTVNAVSLPQLMKAVVFLLLWCDDCLTAVMWFWSSPAFLWCAPVCQCCPGHEPTALDTVEAFHPQKKKWESLSPMAFPRCSTSFIVIRDRLLVVGGVNQVQFHTTVNQDISSSCTAQLCLFKNLISVNVIEFVASASGAAPRNVNTLWFI